VLTKRSQLLLLAGFLWLCSAEFLFGNDETCRRTTEAITWHSSRERGVRQHYLDVSPPLQSSIAKDPEPILLESNQGIAARIRPTIDPLLGKGPFQIDETIVNTTDGGWARVIYVKKPPLRDLRKFDEQIARGKTPEKLQFWLAVFSVGINESGNLRQIRFWQPLKKWWVPLDTASSRSPSEILKSWYVSHTLLGEPIDEQKYYFPGELYGEYSDHRFPFKLGIVSAARPIFALPRSALAEPNLQYSTDITYELLYGMDGKYQEGYASLRRWELKPYPSSFGGWTLITYDPLSRVDVARAFMDQESRNRIQKRAAILERIHPLKNARLIERTTPQSLSFTDGTNELDLHFGYNYDGKLVSARGKGSYSFAYDLKPELRMKIDSHYEEPVWFPGAPYEFRGHIDNQTGSVEIIQLWPKPNHPLLREFFAAPAIHQAVVNELERAIHQAVARDLDQLTEKGYRNLPQGTPSFPRLAAEDIYVFHTSKFQWKVTMQGNQIVGTWSDITGKQAFVLENNVFPQFVQDRINAIKQRRNITPIVRRESEERLKFDMGLDFIGARKEILDSENGIDQFADDQIRSGHKSAHLH